VAGPSAAEQLFEILRAEVADERVDPDVNAVRVRELAQDVVSQHSREAAVGARTPLGNPAEMVDRLVRMVCEWGPLTDAINNPATEEVLIEGDQAFVIADGRVRGLVEPTSEAMNRHVVDQLLAETTVSLDPSNPIVDGVQVLGGRGRLACSVPPVSPHLSACLRLWRQRRVPMADQVTLDTVNAAAANFLTLVMWLPGSIVVSGAPGAGKTTFLSSLLGLARANHCVRVVEEYRELYLPRSYGCSYQCRPPDATGAGEKTLRDLIKFALRMRADILCVGEVRSSESFELTRATHAGTGFCATLHSHSAIDALEVLVMTALAAGEAVDERYVRRTFARGIDVVVHLERDDPNLLAEGDLYRRQVVEVTALAPQLEGDQFSTWPLFERKGGLGSPLAWTGSMPPTTLVERMERLLPKGRRLKQVLEGRVGVR
jgi:pilus assembly protein CpaF